MTPANLLRWLQAYPPLRPWEPSALASLAQDLSQELSQELSNITEATRDPDASPPPTVSFTDPFVTAVTIPGGEQQWQTLLQPYWVPKARRGVIGKSRYAQRLRQQVRAAAAGVEPVLIFGEPGLEKDNLAALIHFGSPRRRQPLVQVDCARLAVNGAELWGRQGGKPGILAALGAGTLVLNNSEQLPENLRGAIATLLSQGTYIPLSLADTPAPPQSTAARIILLAEKPLPSLTQAIPQQIRVPPLRVRKADLEDYVSYYCSLLTRKRGLGKIPITPEAIRCLQAYDFPNNLRELEGLVARALSQLAPGAALTAEILWPAQGKKQQFRLNLLNAYPTLRRFLRSATWPDRVNYWIVLPAFLLTLGVLWFGPQSRGENIALTVFWAGWWPGILLTFPVVGRAWCAVCPFMICGEVLQTLSLKWVPRPLRRWPRATAERWGGWCLWGGFVLILLWEELWDLPDTAYLSACLLLLITAGAVICSQIFERRFWCRYLCPIGGMNGLFAKLSMTELRAKQGVCSAECTTYGCYKGGPAHGEGQATLGCPLYSHPAQLEDNRDCVLCMTCLKACPHGSVAVNLRPPGIELWTTHQPRWAEVALLLLLLNAVALHHLPRWTAGLGLPWDLAHFWSHGAMAIAALTLPALIPLVAQGIIRLNYALGLTRKPRPFLELAYGYLPLVLLATLAHYLPLGLTELGRALPITALTFGLGDLGLPSLVPHPAVVTFLQGTALAMGAILSGVLLQKIARQPISLLLPHHLSIWGLTATYGWLMLPFSAMA